MRNGNTPGTSEQRELRVIDVERENIVEFPISPLSPRVRHERKTFSLSLTLILGTTKPFRAFCFS